MSRYVERNQTGIVSGHFANPQPGIAEELLSDDHADLVAYREAKAMRMIKINAIIESLTDRIAAFERV